MKKEKSKKTKRVICSVVLISLATVGVGYLSYKKVPKFRNFVDGLLPIKETTPTIKTKPSFRKYENFNKK